MIGAVGIIQSGTSFSHRRVQCVANTKMPFSDHDNVDHPVSLYSASRKANELMAHTHVYLDWVDVSDELGVMYQDVVP